MPLKLILTYIIYLFFIQTSNKWTRWRRHRVILLTYLNIDLVNTQVINLFELLLLLLLLLLFYKTISLNFCIRSTSVLFCPLQSSSFHFGPIWPTLVLIGLIWSILFTSVYLVHFGLIRSVRSTSVLLCSIRSFRFYSVHFSLFCSLCSYSVQFGPPWSTLVLFG